MSKTLKTLLTIIVIVMGAMWLLTVYRSCQKNNTEKTGISINDSDATNSDATSGNDKLEDLYEDEDEDESGEASGSDTVTDKKTATETDGTSDAGGTENKKEEEKEEDTSEYEKDNDVSVAGDGIKRNGGEYLVVAGAYISKSNAKKYQKQLAKKGYDSEIRVFIGSDYHSVIIGEYASEGEAIRTADKIGGEAYAHKKRYPRKR